MWDEFFCHAFRRAALSKRGAREGEKERRRRAAWREGTEARVVDTKVYLEVWGRGERVIGGSEEHR